MSAIIESIKVKAEALSKAIDPVTNTQFVFTFYALDEAEFNNTADQVDQGPLVLLVLPINARRSVKLFSVDVQYPLRLFIAHRSNLSDLQTDRQPYIDQMERAVNELILSIYKDDTLEIIGDAETSEVHNDYDFNADGWYLNLTVKLKNVIDC